MCSGHCCHSAIYTASSLACLYTTTPSAPEPPPAPLAPCAALLDTGVTSAPWPMSTSTPAMLSAISPNHSAL
eukprot:7006409-Prymnesium_polylepis.1